MFELKPTHLAGCFELQPKVQEDARGCFVKIFHSQVFAEYGLETSFAEEYYSISNKNVIRGMHFQLPPFDHVKLVYCVKGAVMDVVVDLRVGSPTYGKSAVFELSADNANCIYIPRGMAHGFCSLHEQTIMIYKVSSVYAPEKDSGILWNSIDVKWPTDEAILSERDQSFETLKRFISPFLYA